MSEIIQDWMFKAAQEIVESLRINPDAIPIVHNFIRGKSPFKQDVVYMSVPRCDQCVFWSKKENLQLGMCTRTLYDDIEGWGIVSKARATALGEDEHLLNTAVLETDADFGCVQFNGKV